MYVRCVGRDQPSACSERCRLNGQREPAVLPSSVVGTLDVVSPPGGGLVIPDSYGV